MPKTTAVVKVELDKKLFQREKSKRGGYDFKGYKGEFVCRVGYVDIGHQTSKAGVKILLASGFGTYSQKFKFARRLLNREKSPPFFIFLFSRLITYVILIIN